MTHDDNLSLFQDGVIGDNFLLLGLLGVDHRLIGVLGVDGFRHCGVLRDL